VFRVVASAGIDMVERWGVGDCIVFSESVSIGRSDSYGSLFFPASGGWLVWYFRVGGVWLTGTGAFVFPGRRCCSSWSVLLGDPCGCCCLWGFGDFTGFLCWLVLHWGCYWCGFAFMFIFGGVRGHVVGVLI
jgi:hypothetical protein